MGKKYNEIVKNKMTGKYTLGIDIGTNSVGWAVLDEQYRIVNYKDKKAWGVRLFDAGMTAENRRLKRGMRRRINRRNKRIEFLQEIFSKELQGIDENFLFAISELEKPIGEDEEQKYKQKLTANSLQKVLKVIFPRKQDYTRILKKYPTIYHLRSDIVNHPEQMFDVRLVYLALHHMVKKRGHFLNEGVKIDELKQINYEEMALTINTILSKDEDAESVVDATVCASVVDISKKRETRTQRSTEIKYLDKRLDIIGKALVGSKFLISKLFDVNVEVDNSTTFDSEDFLEKAELILDDSQIELLQQLKQLYITIQFSEVIGNSRFLSDAKVKRFGDFRVEMDALKTLLFGLPEYRMVFISSKDSIREWDKIQDRKKDTRCLYDKYRTNSIDYEIFSKEIVKILAKIEDDQHDVSKIKSGLTEGTFMKKLNTTSNGVIPYQLNLYEAETIMNAQKQYYPELFTEEMIHRITKIISFRIPYYVGPLVQYKDGNKFGWMSRLIDEPVRPWNFDEVVDKAASGESFIQRMVGSCTYLLQEKAMPKMSLTYQLFEVLNELNVTKIDDKRINYEVRDMLIPIFLGNKMVSNKTAQKELAKKGVVGVLSGNQKEKGFATSLSTWIDMANIFGPLSIQSVFGDRATEEGVKKFKMLEEIILWLSIFTEKAIIKERIQQNYPEVGEVEITKVLRLNYKGWGRLSQTLLVSCIPNGNQSAQSSLIEAQLFYVEGNKMLGFQEIVRHERLGFKESIEKKNAGLMKDENEISYELIAELAGSPSIKRAIWQSLQIIKEIESIFGIPKAIVLETAKEEGTKKRTRSRENQWDDIKKELKGSAFLMEIEGKSFEYANDRVWLYLNQLGKCMYTGEKLDISRLDIYEVDHIIPYSLTSDNSFDNRVLVKRQSNQDKGGYCMPLELMTDENVAKIKIEWAMLYDKKLISGKKYTNLLKEKITEEMQEGFANRQLVETRQITKHVIALLDQKYVKEENPPVIVGLKAQINDRVKRDLNIVKIRELSDKHHAVDAYMAAFIHQSLQTYGKDSYINGKLDWKRYQVKKKNILKTEEEKQRATFSWVSNDIKKYGICDAGSGEQITQNVYEYIVNKIDDARFCVTYKTGTQNKDKAFWDNNLLSIKGNDKQKKKMSELSGGKGYLGVFNKVKINNTKLVKIKNRVMAVDVTNIEANRLEMNFDKKMEEDTVYTFEKRDMIQLNGYDYLIVSSNELQKGQQIHIEQFIQKAYIEGKKKYSKDTIIEQIGHQIYFFGAFISLIATKSIFNECNPTKNDWLNTNYLYFDIETVL